MPVAEATKKPIGMEREAAVTFLALDKPLRKPLILDTGAMYKPLAALSQCTENLVARWGIDVKRHADRSQNVVPINNPGYWVTSADYPQDMLRKSQPGLVAFRLIVDEAGNPTSCHIPPTNREKGFDAVVCAALMKRAKFSPALDNQKKPMISYYISRVRFQIPN